MRPRKHHIIVGLLGVLCVHSALASDRLIGANQQAMGDTSVAAGADNAAVTTNPGLLALHQRYDFGAQLQLGPSGGRHWGVSAVDSRTSGRVAMGLAYSGDQFSPELLTSELPGWVERGEEVTNVKRYHDVLAAVAVSFADRKISLGVGGDLTFYDHDRQGVGRTGQASAGLGVRPVDGLTFGLAGTNLVPVEVLADRPLGLAGGVEIDAPRYVRVEVDAGYRWQGPGVLFVGAGAERELGIARLRAGWLREARVDQLTAGIGVETEGGALEYAAVVPLGGAASWAATSHVLSVRFGAPAPIEAPRY